MFIKTNLKKYYAQRAVEYEQIYHKPERQEDIKDLKNILQKLLSERDVLEIACGTGFWTEAIAQTSASIFATDVNNEVLEIAKNKTYPTENVQFQQIDASKLEGISEKFTAAFAGFWVSHLLKSQIKDFLKNLHTKLSSDGLVVLVDNRYAEGSSTPIHRIDESGNTYQLRKLTDGMQYEVLKNFLVSEDFAEILDGIAVGFEIKELEYFWCLSYKPRHA